MISRTSSSSSIDSLDVKLKRITYYSSSSSEQSYSIKPKKVRVPSSSSSSSSSDSPPLLSLEDDDVTKNLKKRKKIKKNNQSSRRESLNSEIKRQNVKRKLFVSDNEDSGNEDNVKNCGNKRIKNDGENDTNKKKDNHNVIDINTKNKKKKRNKRKNESDAKNLLMEQFLNVENTPLSQSSSPLLIDSTGASTSTSLPLLLPELSSKLQKTHNLIQKNESVSKQTYNFNNSANIVSTSINNTISVNTTPTIQTNTSKTNSEYQSTVELKNACIDSNKNIINKNHNDQNILKEKKMESLNLDSLMCNDLTKTQSSNILSTTQSHRSVINIEQNNNNNIMETNTNHTTNTNRILPPIIHYYQDECLREAEKKFIKKYTLVEYNESVNANDFYPIYSACLLKYYGWPKNQILTDKMLYEIFATSGTSFSIAEDCMNIRLLSFDVDCQCRIDTTSKSHVMLTDITKIVSNLKILLKKSRFSNVENSEILMEHKEFFPKFFYEKITRETDKNMFYYSIYKRACGYHIYTNVPISRYYHHIICNQLDDKFTMGKIEIPITIPFPYSAKEKNRKYEEVESNVSENEKLPNMFFLPVKFGQIEPFICIYKYRYDQSNSLNNLNDPNMKMLVLQINNNDNTAISIHFKSSATKCHLNVNTLVVNKYNMLRIEIPKKYRIRETFKSLFRLIREYVNNFNEKLKRKKLERSNENTPSVDYQKHFESRLYDETIMCINNDTTNNSSNNSLLNSNTSSNLSKKRKLNGELNNNRGNVVSDTDISNYINNIFLLNPPTKQFLKSIFFDQYKSKSMNHIRKLYPLLNTYNNFTKFRGLFYQLCQKRKFHMFIRHFIYYHNTQTLENYDNKVKLTHNSITKNGLEIIDLNNFTSSNIDDHILGTYLINGSTTNTPFLSSSSSSPTSPSSSSNPFKSPFQMDNAKISNNVDKNNVELIKLIQDINRNDFNEKFSFTQYNFQQFLDMVEYVLNIMCQHNGMNLELYVIILEKYLKVDEFEFNHILKILFYFIIDYDLDNVICNCRQVIKQIINTFGVQVYKYYNSVDGMNILQYMALRYRDGITPWMTMKEIIDIYIEKYLKTSEFFQTESIINIINGTNTNKNLNTLQNNFYDITSDYEDTTHNTFNTNSVNSNNNSNNVKEDLKQRYDIYTKKLIAIFLLVSDKYDFIIWEEKNNLYYLYTEFGNYHRYISFKQMNLVSYFSKYIRQPKFNLEDLIQLLFEQNKSNFTISGIIDTPNLSFIYSTPHGRFSLITGLYNTNDKFIRTNRYITKALYPDDKVNSTILNSRLLIEHEITERVVSLLINNIVEFHQHFKFIPAIFSLNSTFHVDSQYIEKMYKRLEQYQCYNYTDLFLIPDIYPINKHSFIYLYYIAIKYQFDIFINYEQLCRKILHRSSKKCTVADWKNYCKSIQQYCKEDTAYPIDKCSNGYPVHFDVLLSMYIQLSDKIIRPTHSETIRLLVVTLMMSKCNEYDKFVQALNIQNTCNDNLLKIGQHKYNDSMNVFKDDIIRKKRILYQDNYYIRNQKTSDELITYNESLNDIILNNPSEFEDDLFIITDGLINISNKQFINENLDIIKIILFQYRSYFQKHLEFKKLLNRCKSPSDILAEIYSCFRQLLLDKPFTNYEKYYNEKFYYQLNANTRILNRYNFINGMTRVFGRKIPLTSYCKAIQGASFCITADFDHNIFIDNLHGYSYLIITENREKFAFILNGKSGGGKTHIMNQFQNALSPYCMRINDANYTEMKTRTGFEKDSFMVIINEFSKVNASDVKAVTGGDNEAQKIFKTQQTDLSNTHPHILASNNTAIKINGMVDNVTYERFIRLQAIGRSDILYTDKNENVHIPFYQALLDMKYDQNTIDSSILNSNSFLSFIIEYMFKARNKDYRIQININDSIQEYRNQMMIINNNTYKIINNLGYTINESFCINYITVVNALERICSQKELADCIDNLSTIFNIDNDKKLIYGIQHKEYISQMKNVLSTTFKQHNCLPRDDIIHFIRSHYRDKLEIENALRFFWHQHYKIYDSIGNVFKNIAFVFDYGKYKSTLNSSIPSSSIPLSTPSDNPNNNNNTDINSPNNADNVDSDDDDDDDDDDNENNVNSDDDTNTSYNHSITSDSD